MTHNVKKGLAKWFWQTAKGLRLQALLNAVIGVVVVGLDFAFIYCTKWAIDIATNRAEGELLWPCILLLGIIVVRLVLGFCNRWISAILGVKSQNRVQLRIFSHLMLSCWDGHEDRHSGDVLNRLERDVQDITRTLTETLPSALAVCVRLLGAFLFLYSMDALLAFLMLCISPLFAVLSKLYIRKMRRLTRQVRDTDSRIQCILQESLQHRVVLKTLERQRTMTQRLADAQRTLRSQIRHRTLFSSTSGTLLSTGFSLGYFLTFAWGVSRLQEGTITYGTMLAFIQLVGQIQSPFRDMSRFVPVIVGSLTAGERLMELEDVPLEEEGEPIVFPEGAGIRLEEVTFRYEDVRQDNAGSLQGDATSQQSGVSSSGFRQVDTGSSVCKPPVLDHVNIHIPLGSTTAILGETGAGKTTLIRLILGLLKPDSGHVRMYDDQTVVDASPLTRANLVYVPQGNTLLSGTIRDNLLLGDPTASEARMCEVLHLACADFVLERPEGLDTRCGEGGAGLSEGQCQRIAIARALLRSGCILLLDEATSSLDSETERQLLLNLQRHLPSWKTVIFVTHRLAVLDYCTHTVHLDRFAPVD